jgi:hypothetical protein
MIMSMDATKITAPRLAESCCPTLFVRDRLAASEGWIVIFSLVDGPYHAAVGSDLLWNLVHLLELFPKAGSRCVQTRKQDIGKTNVHDG